MFRRSILIASRFATHKFYIIIKSLFDNSYMACVLIAQSYPALCNPMDCSFSGFSVHGILQAKILEWVAGDLPKPGIEPGSPALQADSLPFEPSGKLLVMW